MTVNKKITGLLLVLAPLIFFSARLLKNKNNTQSNLPQMAMVRKMKNELNVGVKTLPTSLDPINMKWAHEVMVFQALYQTLVKLDENGEVVADLASAWSFDDSKKTVTFTLSHEAKFSNGQMVTSNDVAYSIARHFWPESKSPVKGLLSELIIGAKGIPHGKLPEGINAKENLVVFTLKEHYFPFLLILSMPSFSVVNWEQLNTHHTLVGSGPFNIKTMSPTAVELTKSSSYASKEAHLDSLNFLPFIEKTNAIPMLERGDVDFVFYGVGSEGPPTSTKTVLNVSIVNNPIFAHIFTNTDGILGKNPGLRKKLFQLLRTFAKQSVRKNVTQTPMETLLPPGFLPPAYYSSRLPPLTPEEFINANNHTTPINLHLLASDVMNSEEFFKELQQYFLKAQINLKYTILPQNRFTEAILNGSHSFDLILGGYGANIPDPDGILDPIFGLSGWSFGKYDTSKEKQLLADAKFLKDPKERQFAYEKIIRDFEDRYVVLPFFRDHVQLIHRSEVSDLSTNYWYESEIWKLFWKK